MYSMSTSQGTASARTTRSPAATTRTTTQQRLRHAAASRPAHATNPAAQGPMCRLPAASLRTSTIARAASSAQTGAQQATGAKKGAASPANTTVRVYSTENTNTNLELLLSFVGQAGFELGSPVDMSTFTRKNWLVKGSDGSDQDMGVIYEGEVDMPGDTPIDCLVLRVKPDAKVDREFVARLDLTSKGSGNSISVTPGSWVHKSQGPRFFYATGEAYLPQDTPDSLRRWRAAELDEVKGTPLQRMAQREEWDRIYDYDIYNDLAGYNEDGSIVPRAILGGSQEYPYPRRLRTGRARGPGPKGKLDYETRVTPSGKFWLPMDEAFNAVKGTNFTVYGLLSAIPTFAEGIRRKVFDKDDKLTNFKEVDSMYTKLQDKNFTLGAKDVVDAMKTKAGSMRSGALKMFGISPEDITVSLPVVGNINLGAAGSSFENIKKLIGGGQNLLEFPPPLVAKNRKGAWDSDEEWGRQALAGVNPVCIQAVTSRSQLGSITEAQLAPGLGGVSLDDAMKASGTQPRLLVIDHTEVFEDYTATIATQKGRYGYAGRCVLFHGADDQWRPIAIELLDAEKVCQVYTPSTTPANTWRVARGVFTAVDATFHQLVTHWLRCHACTEPYIIATRRCLSSLHPVFKLMVPHFRFTLQINTNARSSLINAGGIIESTFMPGDFSIELSSKVYGAWWRFDKQGLPADLISRGLAKKGSDGKLKLLLKDYPYADDGMLIWNAVHEWVGKYLHHYYDGKDLCDDQELMAWWKEIVTVGHADKKEGWPELKTIHDLTDILTTIIWVASAHHAAINFSQYAYTGYFLNRPGLVTQRIPQKDTPAYENLNKTPAAGEQGYLDVLTNATTVKAVLTSELLSTHSDNEMYLGDPYHPYITDEAALKLHAGFVASMKAVEEEINKRNKDPARKTRAPLPYEFLAPSSGPGITNRGVPQSVSI